MNENTKKFYELKAEIIQAVAHPIRLAIVEFLADGEQCVCDISKHLKAQRSNVSRHLAILLKSGILENRKEGLKVIYSLKMPCMVKFLNCIENALKEQLRNQAKLLEKLDKT